MTLLEFLTVAVVVLGPLWLGLHYVFGNRRREPPPSPDTHTLTELNELADRLETRIATLERLLDVSSPDWRKKA